MSDFLKVVKVILKDTYRPSKKTKRTGIIVTATIFVLLYLLFESSIVASVVNITPYFKEHAYIPEFLTAIMTF